MLPVCQYWEPPAPPPWIHLCHYTVHLRSGAGVRLVGPRDFDYVRSEDRDIDISRLDASARKEFVAAYLLAKFGGIWIDSSCVVRKSLSDVWFCCIRRDMDGFSGYRKPDGQVATDFMGAAVGSPLMKAYYAEVCRLLRSGWAPSPGEGGCGLGGRLLTPILDCQPKRWTEIPGQLIRPIDPSDVAPFFDQADDVEHARRVDAQAFTYLLSAPAVQAYEAGNSAAQLMHPRSFFSFLINKSLGFG
ncbi:MAG: hypothetical protein ABR964_13680 [Tepidisphaeraceae bacterium]